MGKDRNRRTSLPPTYVCSGLFYYAQGPPTQVFSTMPRDLLCVLQGLLQAESLSVPPKKNRGQQEAYRVIVVHLAMAFLFLRGLAMSSSLPSLGPAPASPASALCHGDDYVPLPAWVTATLERLDSAFVLLK